MSSFQKERCWHSPNALGVTLKSLLLKYHPISRERIVLVPGNDKNPLQIRIMELDESIGIENGSQSVERWKKALTNDTGEHFLQSKGGKNRALFFLETPSSIK